jgi:membrane peptidoglycan carboxypeptidase
MAAAYASFANDGVYNSPRLYVKVEDANGDVVLENKGESHVAMKETTAYFHEPAAPGRGGNHGTGTKANFGGMTIAGKTGTTSENYDRYFVGYTPYYCAAVWTGYKNNEKIVYSGNPAITMWKKVMSKVHENLENKFRQARQRPCERQRVHGQRPAGHRRLRRRPAGQPGPHGDGGLRHRAHGILQPARDAQGLLHGGQVSGRSEYCPAESVEQVAVLDYTRESYEGHHRG